MKSPSVYVFTLASEAISWKSVKQTLTTYLTKQTFVAYYEAITQATRVNNFFSKLHVVKPSS